MDELRLSLIGIGVVIVGGVYVIGKLVERSRGVRVNMPRVEPEITSKPVPVQATEHDFKMQIEEDVELKFRPVASPPAFAVIKQVEAPAEVRERTPAAKLPVPPAAPRDPDLVVSLTLMARDKKKFSGGELRTVLESAGLKLAEFDIYHFRDADIEGDTRAIFSVANIVKPGTFSAATLHELEIPGLALFMQIPGPMTASEAFDAMLEKAQFIAERLHGIIGDELRVPLSPQRTREIRERTLNYDFAQVAQSHSGGALSTPRPH